MLWTEQMLPLRDQTKEINLRMPHIDSSFSYEITLVSLV